MEFETWERNTLIKEVQIAASSHLIENKSPHSLERLKFYSDTELMHKTDCELRNIYVEYKKYDVEFLDAYEEHQEKVRFFNQPECDADFDYWSKQAYWSIDEAIALLFGKNPEKVTWDNIKCFLPVSAFVKKFNELRVLAKRYVDFGQLYNSVLPGIFLAWATRMNLKIPTKLQNAIDRIGIQVADWKSHYEQGTERYDQLHKLYTELIELNREQGETINLLKSEYSKLKQSSIDDAHDLKEIERQSLYKIIAAMAYDGYGYNSEAKKSTIPQEIVEAVNLKVGDKIDVDTVRKWLKKATTEYPHVNVRKTE